MIHAFTRLSDRLLARLLPTATAAAGCWVEWCCQGQFCRVCCYDNNGAACGSFSKC